ncbi:hypothetical protein [Candidatus Nitrososphaera evergladensis]|uniref:hypothetical protein n=1 Tax=Candidatus Nitrososphaera evergladensis TaxID=1459637 RepID=UPI0011E5CAED|nr:hypothetical protein [Candidatus Nitrososphaera evergladensis]
MLTPVDVAFSSQIGCDENCNPDDDDDNGTLALSLLFSPCATAAIGAGPIKTKTIAASRVIDAKKDFVCSVLQARDIVRHDLLFIIKDLQKYLLGGRP